MKLLGSLALAALMTMVHGSINVTTSAVSSANMHGRDDSITWSTSSAGCAHTHNALDADLPKHHNSSTTLTMSQSWRTLISNATSVHYTKTIILSPPGETTTASGSSSTLSFTTTAAIHNSTINFGPPTTRLTVTSLSFSTLTGSEDVHFTVIGDQPDEGTSSLPAHENDAGERTPSSHQRNRCAADQNHSRYGYGYGDGYGFANVARHPRSDLDDPAATPKWMLEWCFSPDVPDGFKATVQVEMTTLPPTMS
ncbi:hypothetical protein DL767_011065 [Monosporascus sp. MG133]|nr:hypothetical protein DL767_011065 [Monosporascus sp. MG133]